MSRIDRTKSVADAYKTFAVALAKAKLTAQHEMDGYDIHTTDSAELLNALFCSKELVMYQELERATLIARTAIEDYVDGIDEVISSERSKYEAD